jgi:hypothetical protein
MESMDACLIAVVDIGKTNAKLFVLDAQSGEIVWSRQRPNEVIAESPVKQLDVGGVETWLLRELATAPSKENILVPANTMATLELPVADTARVGIDGAVVKVPVAQPQTHDGRTALELGSGRYRIHVTGGLAPCQQPQDPTTSA